MVNSMRNELVSKCAEIDHKITKARIIFETSMTEMELQRGYLESLIFDIDEYQHKLVENVVEGKE